jgi:hypothetical protein
MGKLLTNLRAYCGKLHIALKIIFLALKKAKI